MITRGLLKGTILTRGLGSGADGGPIDVIKNRLFKAVYFTDQVMPIYLNKPHKELNNDRS